MCWQEREDGRAMVVVIVEATTTRERRRELLRWVNSYIEAGVIAFQNNTINLHIIASYYAGYWKKYREDVASATFGWHTHIQQMDSKVQLRFIHYAYHCTVNPECFVQKLEIFQEAF